MAIAELARVAPAAAAPNVTPEQMALITKTVAQGATQDELKLYLYDCARHGVHPLDRLIHFTKRGGKYTPVTSIDFMRTRAADSGEMAGSDDPVFVSEGKDVFSATVTVYRLTQGQRFAYSATARWSEYKPDANDFMWKKMPHTMLGKCAEALALRKGFPKQLAGLYAREEMEQASEAPGFVVEAPKAVETVNEATGEVVQEQVSIAPKTERGAAYHWIIRCEDHLGRAGKKKATITFTDGTKATIWNDKAQLFDVCVDLMQKAARVVPTLKANQTHGPTLTAIKPFIGEEDAQEPSREQPPDPPVPITDKEIPF